MQTQQAQQAQQVQQINPRALTSRDWYVINPITGQVIRSFPGHCYRAHIHCPTGLVVESGLQAKARSTLWQFVSN